MTTLSPAGISAWLTAHRLKIEAAGIATAVAVLLVSTLPNLANHPTLTDDEIWVMSASFKLAREGVFGSDMFAGFFNADRHYFFNMPGHHFVIAAFFKLFGAGVVQARMAGVVYAIATLILSYLLARRLAGVAAGLLTLGLLLFLRFNIGFDTGLPLQELAVNIRYDLATVPFLLVGTLVLLSGVGLRQALIAGALFGVATLMQFYGAFLIPIACVFLWMEPGTRQQRLRLVGGLLAAAALVGLPYGIFILANLDDFKGQAGTIDRRADFSDPGFYIDNLLNEPDRFLRPLAFKEVPRGADHEKADPQFLSLGETLTRRPSAKLGVLLGIPLALGYLGWRSLTTRGRAERLLFLCLAGLLLQFVFLESTKFFIYWIPIIPYLCIGIAAAAIHLLGRLQQGSWHSLAAAAMAVVLLLFFAEGSVARVSGLRAADGATGYDRLTREIRTYVPEGSRVVGSTALWWGMREDDFRSYFLFFYLTRPDAGPYGMKIGEFLDGYRPEYIVLTRLATGELEKYLIPADYADLQAYLEQHATKLTRIEGPVVIRAYGFIDIWRLRY